MNKTKFLLRIAIMSVIMHPIVILYLSPFMIFSVGVDLDQYIVWAIGGMPLSVGLNAILAWFVPKFSPKIDNLVNKIKN